MVVSQDIIDEVSQETGVSPQVVQQVAPYAERFAIDVQGTQFLPRIRTFAEFRCAMLRYRLLPRLRRVFWCLVARILGVAGR